VVNVFSFPIELPQEDQWFWLVEDVTVGLEI